MGIGHSRFVKTNGFETHYTESGENGPVLVALHGGGAGSSGEAGMGPLMKHLPPDIRVVAPDSVGGFGLTDPAADAGLGLQSRVDHLEAIVDALCLKRFTLLGNSQGAWVAAHYAALHPDKVERLILLGSATMAQAMGIEVAPTPDMLALLNYDGSRDGMVRLLEGLVYDKSKITKELVELRYHSATRPGAREAFAKATQGTKKLQSDPLLVTQFDMRAVLPRLADAIETIFIWGEDDGFAKAELGRAIEPMVPHVKFHWVPKAGHQVQTDQPEAVGRIVTDFILGSTARRTEAA